jgi:hypothetical protein
LAKQSQLEAFAKYQHKKRSGIQLFSICSTSGMLFLNSSWPVGKIPREEDNHLDQQAVWV